MARLPVVILQQRRRSACHPSWRCTATPTPTRPSANDTNNELFSEHYFLHSVLLLLTATVRCMYVLVFSCLFMFYILYFMLYVRVISRRSVLLANCSHFSLSRPEAVSSLPLMLRSLVTASVI